MRPPTFLDCAPAYLNFTPACGDVEPRRPHRHAVSLPGQPTRYQCTYIATCPLGQVAANPLPYGTIEPCNTAYDSLTLISAY